MPTALPPARILPRPKVRRSVWLRLRVEGGNARRKWLPVTHAQRLAGARRWCAYNGEIFRLLDMPEPDHFADLREVFMRPLPERSTLSK